MKHGPRIGVMGAGSIGCYVGGLLAASGVDVVMVGRERIRAEVMAHGLALEDLDGAPPRRVPKDTLRFETSPGVLANRDVVLVCVKSSDTEETGRMLAPILPNDTSVVSLQNGVHNADRLRANLDGREVLGGIVGFNVVSRGPGVFRRATSGPIVIEASRSAHVARLLTELVRVGLEVESPRDIRPLQWSKLVMNLNNAVSALSDRPTAELLQDDGYRWVLAAIIEEAVDLFRVSKTKTARLGPLPVSAFPKVLRLPKPLLRLVTRAQVKIDPEARSSMWEDLRLRRTTEVEELNGEIVRLAAACGKTAPINARVVSLVHEAEEKGRGSPALTADSLRRALGIRG
jgi:2-dehydropantoate 2-reductase